MGQVLKTLVAMSFAGAALLGAKEAMAGTHGVVFVHGTGDYAGTQSCSGSGSGWKCVVSNALSNYWNQGEVDSIRGGRAYAVVGFHGGSYMPWTNSAPVRGSGTEPANADDIATQIDTFIKGPDGVYGTSDDVTDIVMITHSGGSNQARFMLQQYAASTARTHVKNATKKVITIAAPTLGTYLANEVFTSGSFIATVNSVVTFFGGSGFYNDDGTALIRTTTMGVNGGSGYNGDSAKFGGLNNPVQGVPFRATGGTSTTTCVGVTLWGTCLGVRAPSLGGSSCDSGLMDTGLLALHALYLNSNDSSTARNNCSDGFITCASSQALGGNFGFNTKQDHNQSRRQCNGLDGSIRAEVNNAEQGFDASVYPATQVAPTQWDACGFTQYAGVYNSRGSKIGYTAGCAKSDLGDGYCDWDCVAMYGHDAPATFDANGHVSAWGGTDDCTATADGYGNASSTNDPWADNNTFTTDGSHYYYTQFTGKSQDSSSTTWFSDPNYGTTAAVGYCPQSWIGDGTCDECVIAQYGADGNDCSPGRIQQCGGIITKYAPYSTSSNPIYNEGDPTTGGSSWYFWASLPATANNGVCENTECTSNKWSPCTTSTDCITGTCVSGYCAVSTSQCNTTADCQSGTCVNGGCTTASSDCSSTFTATYGTCSTRADCTVGTCVGGACSNTTTTSLCR